MANLATKAPNFTRENAADMARRAVESRLAREAREKAEDRQRDIEARALAISRETRPEPDEARKLKVQKQIDILLDDMIGADLKERLAISRTLSDLWKLVQSVPGSSKGRASRPAPPAPPAPMPQEPSPASDLPAV